jgi:hypothetical protein
MTERIRKLAEQAGIEFDDDFPLEPETIYYLKLSDFEKFAELIVRECVKVMYDNAIERKVPPDINQTPTHYAIAVLEHFGVNQ